MNIAPPHPTSISSQPVVHGSYWRTLSMWFPLGFLLTAALLITPRLAPWIQMWSLAIALYTGFKWATWYRLIGSGFQPTRLRSLVYLWLWPGMDARSFLRADQPPTFTSPSKWLWAAVKVAAGAGLIWGCARHIDNELVAGWLGMVGMLLVAHFGLLDMVAFFWQRCGINAQPLMQAPLTSRSLNEFWGQRWNSAFRALSFDLMFRPLSKVVGGVAALLLTFFLSGVIHDIVISIPAGGGYGWPTVYFTLQGIGVLAERSRAGQRLRRSHPGLARIFTLTVLLAPVGLLFPPLFVTLIIIPFLHVIGALP